MTLAIALSYYEIHFALIRSIGARFKLKRDRADGRLLDLRLRMPVYGNCDLQSARTAQCGVSAQSAMMHGQQMATLDVL